jgi:hypothetical protein
MMPLSAHPATVVVVEGVGGGVLPPPLLLPPPPQAVFTTKSQAMPTPASTRKGARAQDSGERIVTVPPGRRASKVSSEDWLDQADIL